MTPEDVKLREAALAATPVQPQDLMRYEHGGGRLAIIRDGKRDLIADFYGDGADRDYYAAANPATILQLLDDKAKLLDEVERLRAALEPFATLYRESMRDFPDGTRKFERPDDRHAWGFNNANLTWGDFRRAAALQPSGAGK